LNREENQDGHPENCSANWGSEGPSTEPEITAVRAAVKRAILGTVFFSLGTPMLLAGDEMGRSQTGNNNAYCQDNEISWIDWDLARSPENQALADYVARLAALRRAHPSLRGDRFPHGRQQIAPGLLDIEWFNERGTAMAPEDWADPQRRMLGVRRCSLTADGNVEGTLLLLNASTQSQHFGIAPSPLRWTLAVDSHAFHACGDAVAGTVTLAAHSLILLVGRHDEGGATG
jgi:glycogen operon protein